MSILLGALAAFVFRGGSAPPERRVLLPFDYSGVRITGGVLRSQLDETREFYLRIPNDDLLIGFRKRAGLPAPGEELGGWYSADIFHIFGQILSGLARLYAATGDPACKAKADALFDGWRACIAPDGYFFYSAKPNAQHYIYDKMVGGLVDLALYTGRRDALDSLAKITGWAEKNLDRTRPYGADGREWYTLSENLCRAYLLTGDDRYRRFAQVWEYTPYWKRFAEGRSIFDLGDWRGKPVAALPSLSKNTLIGYHAYSHLNTLGGAALAYRVSGEPWYLDSIRNAYDLFQKEECFATGGFGPDETLLPKADLEKKLQETSATFETQCGTWAIFKLCKNLIALTGDAKYGDWVEKAAYNGIGATIPETPTGGVFYYSSYNPFGGKKVNHWDAWSCCAGTRPMAIADVADLIYFRAPDGLNVNLYVPSSVRFEAGGTHVEIEQATTFPEVGAARFVVHPDHAARFALRFREPDWLAGKASAKLNGSPVTLSSNGKYWIELKRTWHSGDQIGLTLPMRIHSVPFDPSRAYPTAIAIGPVILAFRSATSPVDKIDLARLPTEFVASPGEPLTYHLRAHPDVLARPFYAFKEGEEYTMYLDPAAAHRVGYHRFRTEGAWRDSGRFWFGNQVGAWCECSFEGDGVRLIGWAYDDGGRGEVRIDGKVVGVIDQYGPGRDLPWDWRRTGLGPGRHTIRIAVLSAKDPASKDRYINIGGVEVLDSVP